MKNLQNFEEFRNEQELNEGIFSALQSIWKFFKGVSKTLQTNIGNYTKKLDNSKTWQDTLTNINSMVIQPNIKYFEENMKTATNISQIRKINYEVHISTFTELNATYKKWDGGNPKSPLTPSAIFVGTPFANMYNFIDTQKFTQNLTNAINGLISTFAKSSGYPMDDVTKSINSYKDLTQNPPDDKGTTTPEQKPEQNQQQNQQQQNNAIRGNSTENRILKFSNFTKLYEADQQPTNQQPTTPEQPIDKLKTENINNFKNNFYGTMQKKLKAFKPAVGNTGTDPDKEIDAIAKTMTGSGKNIDSKKNLLKTIKNPKLTADQLGKVRDAVSKVLNIPDPKKSIGTF